MLTILPAASARAMVGAFSGSTPQMRDGGFDGFDGANDAGDQAAAADADNDIAQLRTIFQDFQAQRCRCPPSARDYQMDAEKLRPCATHSSARAKATTASDSSSTWAP